MNREERKYFYEKLRELFAEWVNDANTDVKYHIYDTITSFEERYMTSTTGQQPFPQELFRVFLEEHALVHKLQQRGAFKVVTSLPEDDIDIYSIYIVRRENVTEEYIYYNNDWLFIGNTEVNMHLFYTKEEVNELLLKKVDSGELNDLGDSVEGIRKQQQEFAKDTSELFDNLNETIGKNQGEINKVIERIEKEIDRKQDITSASLATNNKTITGAINELKSSTNTNKDSINQLNPKVSQLELSNQQLKDNLAAAQGRMDTLEGENTALRKEVTELGQLIYAAL